MQVKLSKKTAEALGHPELAGIWVYVTRAHKRGSRIYATLKTYTMDLGDNIDVTDEEDDNFTPADFQ